jgi:hypothetical protein
MKTWCRWSGVCVRQRGKWDPLEIWLPTTPQQLALPRQWGRTCTCADAAQEHQLSLDVSPSLPCLSLRRKPPCGHLGPLESRQRHFCRMMTRRPMRMASRSGRATTTQGAHRTWPKRGRGTTGSSSARWRTDSVVTGLDDPDGTVSSRTHLEELRLPPLRMRGRVEQLAA